MSECGSGETALKGAVLEGGSGQGLRSALGVLRELDGGGEPAHATARLSRESSINGLLQVIESQSRVNSFMGGAAHARARVSPAVAAPVSAAPALFPLSSLGRALVSSGAAVADAHATTFTLHGASNSWSDTVRVRGPKSRKRSKGGVSGPAEDLLPVSEGGGRGKFSARRVCTGARLLVTHLEGNQAQEPEGRLDEGV